MVCKRGQAEIPASLPGSTCCLCSLCTSCLCRQGDTLLSLVPNCPFLCHLLCLPAALQPAVAEGSGLVIVPFKDTELSCSVTLFKCLIKLNLACLDRVMYLFFFLFFFFDNSNWKVCVFYRIRKGNKSSFERASLGAEGAVTSQVSAVPHTVNAY